MVASTIQPVEIGNEFEKLPVHLTVIPWFALDEQRWPDLDEEIHEIMIENPAGPFPRSFVGEQVKYGPDQDIAARRAMIDAMGGFPMYASLYGIIRHLGSELDTTYAGLAWSPHISDTTDHVFTGDEPLKFNNLTVFQRQSNHMKRVKALYRWGTHVDEATS